MLLNNELDKYKPWLVSVARTGSSTLPWIHQPHDTDYIIYVTDVTCGRNITEFHKYKPENECWMIDLHTDEVTLPRLYAYQYKFLVPVYGTEFPKYDIFKHAFDYKQRLVSSGLNKEYTSNMKHWYHTLTGIYMLNNGCYDLTEEQAANVRLCHERKMTEEIYNYIQEQLEKYKKELDELKTNDSSTTI